MILHKDGLILMDYDVASDILVVKWLASKTSSSSELSYTMKLLVDKIRSYDIKNLLIDAREDVIGITDEEYVEINMTFAQNLASTRLQRVARLGTTNTNRENFVQELAEDVQALPEANVVYQEFQDETIAIQWLQQNGERSS
ncbi:hypothetical protein H8S95_14570 [Pontibacter sp. KCTC 32443]|uniref:hypothetical protein n=1 Tax=Pontibacter TaxID=323449 RepID=UPI00164DF941|nr:MULTISPECIES: hypothetical protein [Pontibacter]MBC5775300.1 hypothetical protein [Pontibacter sp. KCTC 32443]